MATSATLIPVSEYLNTTYRPDRDYVDGVLRVSASSIAISLTDIFAQLDEF